MSKARRLNKTFCRPPNLTDQEQFCNTHGTVNDFEKTLGINRSSNLGEREKCKNVSLLEEYLLRFSGMIYFRGVVYVWAL